MIIKNNNASKYRVQMNNKNKRRVRTSVAHP